MKRQTFFKVAFFATCLAYVVVLLGAYTRLSDAGLGCPDWPGCYGHIDVPNLSHEVEAANQAYPDRPVEAHKAWKEMIHRYFAGTLGLFVFALGVLALRNRADKLQPFKLPLFLMAFVVFQALLGMWTVTIKLNPTIVMSHLMGGLTTLSILWWMSLRSGKLFSGGRSDRVVLNNLQTPALIALLVVILQIMLGGWTSSNYAALQCTDFPTCQGQWWPAMNFAEGFTLWHGTDKNFEFGILSNEARVAIHFTHRLGALLTFLVVGWLGLKIITSQTNDVLRSAGITLLIVLILQVTLGIMNVVLSLPLANAVAHNGGGALLLLTLVTINHLVRPQNEAF